MKIAITILVAKQLILSFEYKENNPDSLFPFYTASEEAASPGNSANPAYLPLWEFWYINSAYGKPYSIQEINSCNIGLGTGFNNFGLQIRWSRFGIDEYMEDVLEGNTGYKICKYLYSGIGLSYYHLNIRTQEISQKENMTDFRLSFLVIPINWIRIGLQLENIVSIINKDREDLLYPNKGFGITVKPVQGIAFTWNINRIYYDYINSYSITSFIHPNLCLKAGYCREISTYSAAFIFLYQKTRVSYGLRHHSYLGLTHTIGVTVTSIPLIFEQVNYNKKLFRQNLPQKRQKVNIKYCNLEELTEIPVLTKVSAERIIKYRDIIGPVSRKSLYQIGLSEKKINQLLDYISGLSPVTVEEKEDKNEKAFKTYKYSKKDYRDYKINLRKKLFQKLLEIKIKASTAFKIVELAKGNNRKELIREIGNQPDITLKEKTQIINICEKILY